MPTCGIFSCVPAAVVANPNPSAPITTPFCSTTRLPSVTRSRMATWVWITQSSPMLVPAPTSQNPCSTVRAPMRAPRPTWTNGPTWASGAISAPGIDDGRGMNAGWPPILGGRQQRQRARERHVGLARAEHGAGRSGRLLAQDDGRGAGGGPARARISDSARNVRSPGPGGVEPHDTNHLDVTVAVQAAPEPLGEFAKLHGAQDITRSEAPSAEEDGAIAAAAIRSRRDDPRLPRGRLEPDNPPVPRGVAGSRGPRHTRRARGGRRGSERKCPTARKAK